MAAPVQATNMATQQVLEPAAVAALTSVFQPGKLPVEVIQVDHDDSLATPPLPVLIAAPKDAGTYPVAMLLHGFFLQNRFYEQLLKHVASFGFVMVAPQFHTSLVSTGDADDIAAAARVTDWLPVGLPSVLPAGVDADLSRLALAGHSRGGHTAFALALGHATKATALKFSALIGLDPVAGTGRSAQLPPAILTYEPSSLDIAMPALVIGTGLGDDRENVVFPPCAPGEVSHAEFYRECKAPCYHLVTRDYGHLDMLDDDAPKLVTCLCKGGKSSCKGLMRKTVAGIMVAFLRSALGSEEDDGDDLKAILRDPGLAPATLDPVEYRLA